MIYKFSYCTINEANPPQRFIICTCLSLSEQASNMKETAEVVKAALDETERAQSVAMDAIQLAQNNTKGTLNLLISVSLTAARIQMLLSWE